MPSSCTFALLIISTLWINRLQIEPDEYTTRVGMAHVNESDTISITGASLVSGKFYTFKGLPSHDSRLGSARDPVLQ